MSCAAPPPAVAAPLRPADEVDVSQKALWLLLSYGYCALSDSVVELYKPGDDCQLKPAAFQRLYRAWREETIGPRGGRDFAYATGYWEVNRGRVDIAINGSFWVGAALGALAYQAVRGDA